MHFYFLLEYSCFTMLCWFLLYNEVNQLWKWKSLSRVQLFATPLTISPWNFPGQKAGVGSLSLLQGIFPIQGSNPGLPHCRQILYQLSPKGSPRILEWITYPFLHGSSWPRNQTGVSCIAGRFFVYSLYTYIPSLQDIPPIPLHATHLGHHRAPSWAPCAIQQVPTSYLFYTCLCIYVPISQFIPPPPTLVLTCLFSMSMSLFVPCK